METCPECRYDPKTTDSPHKGPYKSEFIKAIEAVLEATPWICPVGCQLSINHNALEEHVRKCTPYECTTCNEVKVATKEQLTKHEAACPENEIACKQCDLKIKQKQLDKHQSYCPEAEVSVRPVFFGPADSTIKLKRKHAKSLEGIDPDQHDALRTLFSACRQKSEEPKPNKSQQRSQMPPLLKHCLSIEPQNIRVLAETEFTARDVFASAEKNQRQSLLNIPITPIRSKYSYSFNTIYTMIQKLHSDKHTNSANFGFVCTLYDYDGITSWENLGRYGRPDFLDSSDQAANKQYNFTLSGISEEASLTLMKTQLSPIILQIATTDQDLAKK